MKKILFWAAIIFGLVNVAFGIGSVIFARLNALDWPQILGDGGWIVALSMASIGVLIAVSRSRNPLGWIFLAIGFSQGLVSFAFNFATFVLVTSPGALPGGPLMSFLGQIAWIPGLVLELTFAILLFPTGHLPSRRWRIVAWASALPLILFIPGILYLWPYRGLVLLLHPDQAVPTGVNAFLSSLLFPLMLLPGLACVVSLFIRFRKADYIERQQIKWVAFAAGLFLIVIAITDFTPVGAYFYEKNYLSYLLFPFRSHSRLPLAWRSYATGFGISTS